MKVQDLKDTPQRNEELKKLEADMPRLLEKAAKSCKAKTGVVCDGFHPKVPLDLTRETRGKIVEFLKKVEQCGRWLQQACTRMFFLNPKNVTTERPIALMPVMVRWWEAMRAPEIAKWQHKYRFESGTIDGRNGGAERAVWETLLEMERFTYHAGEGDQGATALLLDFAKAFERVSLCGLGQGISTFTQKKTRVLCWYFEHQRRVQFEGCVAEALQTITAILLGSKWSYLLLRIVLQDALSEVTKIFPPLKLRVFVDDITAFLKRRNKELVEMAKKVLKNSKKEVEEKGLKPSITEGGKEGKSKAITSCKYLEERFQHCSKR